MRAYTNGEHYLLLHSPIFKRRYTVDCDIIIGCTIGCKFCYYRWVEGASGFYGTGKLHQLCSPEQLAEILSESKLVRKDRDGIMLCARSDGSMQTDAVAIFLKEFRYRNPVFLLHRGPFGQQLLDKFGNDQRVVFCTTITPGGYEFGWTPIRETAQIKGIEFLLSNGVPARRISVEIGPINENNIVQTVEIIKTLDDMGLEFATYRGVSVGTFNKPSPNRELENIGFLTGRNQRQNAPSGHVYYRIKNYISPGTEKQVLEAAGNIRLHRFTGTLYRDEFGLNIAYNRNNRWREELGMFPETDPDAIKSFVEGLGFPVTGVEKTPEGYMVHLDEKGPAVTEDVAMLVGTEFNTCILFSKHKLAPDMEDIEFYLQNRLLVIPGRDER